MSLFSRSKESWTSTPPPCPPKSRARYSVDWNTSRHQLRATSYVDILNDRQDWLDEYTEQANQRTILQRKTKSLRNPKEKQTKKGSTSLGMYHGSRSANSLSDYQGYSRSHTSSVRSFTYSPPPPPSISNSPLVSSGIPPVPPVPKQLQTPTLNGTKSTTPEYMGRFSQDLAEIEHDIRILEIERDRHSQYIAKQKEEIKRMQRDYKNEIQVEENPTRKKKSPRRKRGKTLPGNLATPPPQASQLLPPMILNPIEINIPTGPTKISKPCTSASTDLLKSHYPKRSHPKPIAKIPVEDARYPKSVYTTLKYYGQYLSEYEKKEIQTYPEIYFVGPHAERKYSVTDDDRGNYQIVLQDHLAYRYEILSLLGRGSFGQVVQCLDHKTGQRVAVKLIRNKQRFYAQALTELNILRKLIEWDPKNEYHTVRMIEHFQFRGHLCITFECLSMNLYEFIKNNRFQGFGSSLIKRLTLQMLQALNLLYDHQVIHCDLKPENILLEHPKKNSIKIIDFGSSCFASEKVYTYIQSRFYRSPEVILGLSYHIAIDMWSLGCIVAELHTGVPLFPGGNEQEQLACIMEVIGIPQRYLIEKSSRKKLFFDSNGNPRIVYNSKGKKRHPNTKPLYHAVKSRDIAFVDFIQKCLTWDPNQRMTPKEALEHEWICK